MQTVWITKYALSEGIHQAEFKGLYVRDGKVDEDVACVKDSLYPFNSLYHKGEWHKTEAGAKVKANEMRLKKIKSLEKQIEKLHKLEF